jgi:hypothetical protein
VNNKTDSLPADGQSRRRRHEITAQEIEAFIEQPFVSLLASAHGPGGSKTIEAEVHLRTGYLRFIVKSGAQETSWENVAYAVNAYNEAPGP